VVVVGLARRELRDHGFGLARLAFLLCLCVLLQDGELRVQLACQVRLHLQRMRDGVVVRLFGVGRLDALLGLAHGGGACEGAWLW